MTVVLWILTMTILRTSVGLGSCRFSSRARVDNPGRRHQQRPLSGDICTALSIQ
jgi:hypothetical protein